MSGDINVLSMDKLIKRLETQLERSSRVYEETAQALEAAREMRAAQQARNAVVKPKVT